MSTAATAPAKEYVTPVWPGAVPSTVESKRKWSRSDTLTLANERCYLCFGLGLFRGRLDSTQPCGCVLRSIFDRLLKHYDTSFNNTGAFSRCTLAKLGSGHVGRLKWSWGFQDNEFICDFESLAKRILLPFESQSKSYSIFRAFFLQNLDWRDCCKLLRIEKGPFWHEVYRIMERIGRAAREMRPYSLFPINEYYGAQGNKASIARATPPGDIQNANRMYRTRKFGSVIARAA